MNTLSHAVNGPPSARTASRQLPPPGATSRNRSPALSDAHFTFDPFTRPPSGPGSVTSSGSPDRTGGDHPEQATLAARSKAM